ncbi:MAG: GAF domain-containing protein, partial [Myxococcota bacterium]
MTISLSHDASGAPQYEIAVFEDVSAECERNERLAKQQRALSELAKGVVLRGMAADDAIRSLTQMAAETLGVERASYWRLDADRTAIECVDLFERAARRHSAGARLTAADYPRYFTALLREEPIAAADARADARTSEFSGGYLESHGIGAMLDAPVFVNGRPAGVLCHEHVGGPRDWQSDELVFAAAIAGMVALTLEGAERLRADWLAALEHAITKNLAQADSASSGLRGSLAILCESERWEAARYYGADDEAGLLRCRESWTISDAQYRAFNAMSSSLAFARGVGVPGLVWESGEPTWVPDVTKDARIVISALAGQSAIRSAFMFPVASRGRT